MRGGFLRRKTAETPNRFDKTRRRVGRQRRCKALVSKLQLGNNQSLLLRQVLTIKPLLTLGFFRFWCIEHYYRYKMAGCSAPFGVDLVSIRGRNRCPVIKAYLKDSPL